MLPKAIQAQIEAADQFVEQMNGTAPTNVDTPPQAPEAPVEPQPPAVPVPAAAQPQAQPADDEWKNRFMTLRGKYDAEVPRLSQQVRELQTALQTLVGENEQLKATKAQVAEQPITDADREAFGADLINVVERAAKSATTPLQQEVERLKAERAQLKAELGSVNQEVAVSAQDRFQTKLTQMVPDWETINGDQNFLIWLGQIDPVFMTQRQAALDAAANRLDAAAAAAVFNAFKAIAAPKPTVDPRQELQSQVAPSRSRVAAVPVADDGANKIWSDADIKQFYADVRRGAYTTAEADRIEDQLNRAVAEGRVR